MAPSYGSTTAQPRFNQRPATVQPPSSHRPATVQQHGPNTATARPWALRGPLHGPLPLWNSVRFFLFFPLGRCVGHCVGPVPPKHPSHAHPPHVCRTGSPCFINKVKQNPPKYIEIHRNPSKSIEIHRNPLKSIVFVPLCTATARLQPSQEASSSLHLKTANQRSGSQLDSYVPAWLLICLK